MGAGTTSWLFFFATLACITADESVTNLIQEVLLKLDEIKDETSDARQDIIHRVGDPVSHANQLDYLQLRLQTISLQNIVLQADTLSKIKTKTETARTELKEVIEDIKDADKLAMVGDRLEGVENMLGDLVATIEEELELEDSDSHTFQLEFTKLQEELKQLKDRAQEALVKEAAQKLPREVIESIQEGDLSTAEDRLNKIVEDSKITFIVRNVYNHHIENFDLVFDFGVHVQNKTKQQLLMKALFQQMKLNKHENVKKFIKIKKILDKTAKTKFTSSMHDHIEDEARKVLVKALKDDTFKDGVVKDMLKEVYIYKWDSYRAVVTKAMDDAYVDVATEKWLAFGRDSAYIEQMIICTGYVWERMHKHNEMKTNSVTDVAFTVKGILEEGNFHIVSKNHVEALDKIKSELPLSIKNAAFSEKVCFINLRVNEHMYSPIDNWRYDDDRRRVFTWIGPPDDRDESGTWKIISEGSGMHIRNLNNEEYLYAAGDSFTTTPQRRSVFTWRRKNKVTNGVWHIEPEGNDCYIKNKEHNEYLIGGEDRKWDQERRQIHTAYKGEKLDGTRWRIDAC